MILYRIPHDEEFYKQFGHDVKKAKQVIIVSPYLSMETIRYWRNLCSARNAASFTVIFDIRDEQEGPRNGITGQPQKEVEERIEWRQYDRLHAKLYYFEFNEGYAFYHGSANFTDRGLGESSDRINYNVEVMSRITVDDNVESVRETIRHFLDYSKPCKPIYKKGQWIKGKVTEESKIMEFKQILKRIYREEVYFPEKAESLNDFEKMPLSFFKGLFVSKNHRYLKMHTTINDKSAIFTIFRQELKWFLGNFEKRKCLSSNRQLLLVIKYDGLWNGRLSAFHIRPLQLFELLADSKRIQKLRFSKESVNFTIIEHSTTLL
ncbi:hypothetical protein EHV15_14300 [Paenibacillus oralis]|uniref:Uncharacterized protein n=1 Tax=Paenibacillus oralis TaxID=2490856 RepID=A0A3P3U0V2_9BACL|nr:phospholipase D-like domain-containing protein [Paenibacillus oralis]RRJ63971.1 hypothetical protein EHV15_14300 [Paenibacillus oralis]